MSVLVPIFPAITNQVRLDPDDVDDCWCVALSWTARASDPAARWASITEVRTAAGDPDDGKSDGGSLDESYQAALKLWPHLAGGILRCDASVDGLLRLVREGRPASVAVWSGALPSALRYGFTRAHQVGLGWDGGFLIANPLAPEGSRPAPISESALRAALTSAHLNNGGRARAVLFPPQEETMVVVTERPFSAPRTVRIKAGQVISGYDPSRAGGPVVTRTFGGATSASATAEVFVAYPGAANPPVPRGGPFLRVDDGVLAGLLIVAALVTLDPSPAPPVLDCNAAVKAATDPLNAKIAAARKALG